MNQLSDDICRYYQVRGLKWPTFDQAMAFVHTELGETYEIILAEHPGWVRNHPEAKPAFSLTRLSEELGDVIMMLVVAGMVRGVDPLHSLQQKLNKYIGDE